MMQLGIESEVGRRCAGGVHLGGVGGVGWGVGGVRGAMTGS